MAFATGRGRGVVYLALRLSAENAFQAAEEDCGMDVLQHGFHGETAEVFQVEQPFELAIEGFNAPAPMVTLLQGLWRKAFLVEQGSHQHLQLPAGEPHTDTAHADCLWPRLVRVGASGRFGWERGSAAGAILIADREFV